MNDMTVPAMTFLAIALIGIIGLGATAMGTSSAPPDPRVPLLRDELAAKDRLVEALTRKADAMENLANEREKTLILYRQMVPGYYSAPVDSSRIPAPQTLPTDAPNSLMDAK
jgi:hypothetical protein